MAFLQLASRGQQRVNRALNLSEVVSASRSPPQLEGGDGRFEGSRKAVVVRAVHLEMVSRNTVWSHLAAEVAG